ncbi:MAG: glycosyltransferase family 4 protein [Candidatus Njordarchaeia archaeon]
MRISLIITANAWGGAEEFVYQLAKSLSKSDHYVTIMGNSEVIGYYNDLKNNVKIVDLGKLFEPPSVRRLPFLRALFRHFNAVRISKRLTKELYRKKPDVVHFNQPSVLLLWAYISKFIREKNIPVVYTAHGLDFEMNHIINTLFPLPLVRKLIESFDIVITPSKFMLEELKKKRVVANVCVIPNGIDYKGLTKIGNPQKNKKNKLSFRMIFPGGGKLWKGGKEVLEAVYYLIVKNTLPNINLIITRPVSKNHIYQRLIQKYNIKDHVKLVGLLSREKYYQLLAASDILIMPSKKEAFGIVFLEAMALGKPIIATNLGGIPEVVEDKHNGYLCDGSPEELARLIEFLYKNPKIRKKISRINPQRAKRFDWNAVANMYLNAYKLIAGSSKSEDFILRTLV